MRYQIHMTLAGHPDALWQWHIEDRCRRVDGVGGEAETAKDAGGDAVLALAGLLALQQPAPAAYMHGR